MKNKLSRRALVKMAVGAAAAYAVSCVVAPFAAATRFFKSPPWKRKKPYYGFAIDIDRCIGCGRCVEACKVENDVPRKPFFFRTWVERYMIHRTGEVQVESPNGGMDGFDPLRDPELISKSFFVPKLCNLCENSPCIQVCPVGATFKTEDGVVLIDKDYCIGCRYCIQACPYGTRYFNPITRTADKCTLCYHRITKGLNPACVEVCPRGTRIFGDLSDPKSKLNRFIERNRVHVLKPHMGTNPKTVYKGLGRNVR